MQNRTQLLANPSFQRFWASRVLSSTATQIQAVAVGWQIYDLTNSQLQLGLVGLAQFLPMVLFTIPAGHAADRYHRRLIATLSQVISGVMMLLLAWGSYRGWVTPVLIYTSVAMIGAARAFQQPAMSALLPGLIGPTLFPRAMALSASAVQTATILGPSIGGLLYGFGPAVPFGIATGLLLFAAACTTTIRSQALAEDRTPPGWNTVFSGISYIAQQKVILGAISLDLFAVLLGGATALLPVYARDILHAGPTGLGLLRGAPAAGALLMSVWLARRPLKRHVGHRMFAAVMVFGFATILFAVSRSLPLSVAALLVMGAADVISVVVRQSLVQMRTPDAMRGRVSAVNFLFIGTSNQLGEFESGVTASLIGTVPAVMLGGIGTVLVALLWMQVFPALRRLDYFDGATSATKVKA